MKRLFRFAFLAVTATAIPALAGPTSDSGASQLPASLMALAGYAPLSGEGVVITLTDRKTSPVKGTTGAVAGLVHDYDVLTIVNQLRSAGAQGITVGGVRLTNQSSINCVGPRLLVDKTPFTVPVRIEAVGNAAFLKARLSVKGGVLDFAKSDGPSVQMLKSSKLRLGAAPLPHRFEVPHTGH